MKFAYSKNRVLPSSPWFAFAWSRLALLLAISAPLAALKAQSNYATPYTFTTFAGAIPNGVLSADGIGAAARFNTPYGVAVDSAGQIYVADSDNFTIRKITPAGLVSTIAGLAGESGITDGTGSAARFSSPQGLVADTSGNIFVIDNHTVRKISPAGVVTTIAGLADESGWTDGLGSLARFASPCGIAIDSFGVLYVADAGNDGIRKISSAGEVTTLAGPGSGGNQGNVDGLGSEARFYNPRALTVDENGNIYVADTGNNSIRKITPLGAVTTLAGTVGLIGGLRGSADGVGSAARFSNPEGIAIDAAHILYISDSNNGTVRRITPAGAVTTLAGSANSPGPNADGLGSQARFSYPANLALNSAGLLYLADRFNNEIRAISTSDGMVITLAGQTDGGNSVDGAINVARFNVPTGMTFDPAGNFYLADSGNSTIRKITPAGSVTTFAGVPQNNGSADGSGSTARFNIPAGVASDSSGNLYVTDYLNHTVRKVTSTGLVSTLAGVAEIFGTADAAGSAARFNHPYGVAVDSVGSLYVSDSSNHTIRKITASGVVTTLAGLAGSSGSLDGTGSAARFNYPGGVAVDLEGNVFVADTYSQCIRKISAGGVVTTMAGLAGSSGSLDGTGSAARFSNPGGVAVDGSGNVFVCDSGNTTIRKISPAGVVTTVAGTVGMPGFDNGVGGAARFTGPFHITLDGAGNIYVAESDSHVIKKGVLSDTALVFTTQPTSQSVLAGSGATFTVAANGIPAPTFQWQKNGVNISGATSNTYTIGSVTAGDIGNYRVVATNTNGYITSIAASLDVPLVPFAPTSAVIFITVE